MNDKRNSLKAVHLFSNLRWIGAQSPELSMGHIVDLSTELLELTISAILEPRDLFNLALTCKGLYNLIVPYHLYFREIVTMWVNEFDCALWNTISQRPILAHHTQTLQFVLPTSDHIGLRLAESRARVLENVEGTPGGSLLQEISETIPKSISKMVNLRIFMWHDRPFTIWWSCIRGIFDELDNCLNLTSLTVNNGPGREGKDLMLPLPAQQLSFLTALALAVPCLCESCSSMSFYQKLLLKPLETLQDVDLELPVAPLHKESPVSSQWHDVFETVNWPNIRRLTLRLHRNDLRTSLSGLYPILESFIARHPLMESLAYFVDASSASTVVTLDFSFILKNPSKLHSLKYIYSNCCYLPEIREMARVCDLQFVNTSFYNGQVGYIGSLPSLRFCSLTTDTPKFLARMVQLFPGVEKLDITLLSKKQPSIFQISNYIANLEGLNKLTHLAGLLSSYNGHENVHSLHEDDHFLLNIAAETIPSLTHVEICHNRKKVWALIERNAEGGYMGYKKWCISGPPDWGLFFLGIPKFYNWYTDEVYSWQGIY